MLNNLIKVSVLFIVAVTFLCNFGFTRNKPSQQAVNAILSADQSRATRIHDTTVDGRKVSTFSVPVSLYNLGNKPLKFWIMNCAWPKFYGTNNDYLGVAENICTRNFAVMITLAPHESFVKLVPLIFKKYEVGSDTHFKISMSLLEDSKYHLMSFNIEAFTKNNLIWSNEIKVP